MFETAPTADDWRRQYEHAQERYEAQFRLNAELIAGLKKAQAEAWDEGFDAARDEVNPYREAK